MQNIKKIKVNVRERDTGISNVFDGEPFTVANTDLIGAHVIISLKIEVV